jgi:hypothetical protein
MVGSSMSQSQMDQCKALVVEAARCVDAGQYAALSELFTLDAVLIRPNGAELRGRDAIRKSYEAGHTELVKRHLVTQSVCLSQSPTTVKLLTTVILWKELTAPPDGHTGLPRAEQILGEFEDEFATGGEACLIRHRVARFLLRA